MTITIVTGADGSGRGSGSGSGAQPRPQVTYDRRELSAIFGVYGRMVAAGIWRDYAIDFLRDRAVFSVFRRSAEHPLYRIEKIPKLALRQGAYAVLGPDGRVLKRGRDLPTVLRVFDGKLVRAVE